MSGQLKGTTWGSRQAVWLDLEQYHLFSQIIKKSGQIFEGIFIVGHNFDPLWIFLSYRAIFHFCQWPNVAKKSSHLVTVPASRQSQNHPIAMILKHFRAFLKFKNFPLKDLFRCQFSWLDNETVFWSLKRKTFFPWHPQKTFSMMSFMEMSGKGRNKQAQSDAIKFSHFVSFCLGRKHSPVGEVSLFGRSPV